MSLALSPPAVQLVGHLMLEIAVSWPDGRLVRGVRLPASGGCHAPHLPSLSFPLLPLSSSTAFISPPTPSLCFSSLSLYLSKNSPFAPKTSASFLSPRSILSTSVIPLSFQVPPLLSCFYHPSCFPAVWPDCQSGAKSSCLTLCGRPHSAYFTCHVLCGIMCLCVLQSGLKY